MPKKCVFYLRNDIENCCCAIACHNCFDFGFYHDIFVDIYIDNDTYIKINTCALHETYNKSIGEKCLCCEKDLFQLNNYNCSECGCFLCNQCFLRGRYSDEDAQYCYNCRKFGSEKNSYYWTNNILAKYSKYPHIAKKFNNNVCKNIHEWFDLYDSEDDWMSASWYY